MQTLSVHPVSVTVPSRPQRAGEEARLFERYRRTGNQAARAELVERFLPLTRHLANRYRLRGESDDLVQVASYALVKAIDRYDLDRGLAFSSFAVPTIIGELKRYFRDHGWAVRVPRELQERALQVRRTSEQLSARLGRSPTPAEIAFVMDCRERRPKPRRCRVASLSDSSRKSTFARRAGGCFGEFTLLSRVSVGALVETPASLPRLDQRCLARA